MNLEDEKNEEINSLEETESSEVEKIDDIEDLKNLVFEDIPTILTEEDLINEKKFETEEEKTHELIISESVEDNFEAETESTKEEEKDSHPYLNNEEFTFDDFKKIIEERNKLKLFEMLQEYSIPTIVDYVLSLDDIKDIIVFFKMSDSAISAEIFSELDTPHQETIINAFSDIEIQNLVEELATDDLVNLVDSLPSNLVQRIFANTTKENRKLINTFLKFKENSAGSLMTTEYLILKQSMTIKEAINKVRSQGRFAETIQTLFVLDHSRVLIGVVPLDDIMFAEDDELISDIMSTDYVFAYTSTDQEEVSDLFKKYNLNVIPVTNSEMRMLGIITVDDILDVVEQEATEDINLIAGIAKSKKYRSYNETSVWRQALYCFPWLIILLVVGTLTGLILTNFESQIAVVPVLTAFIPTIMSTAGNSGSQTSTVITRSLSLKEITPKKWYKVLGKEVLTGLIIGSIVGIFTFCYILFELAVKIIHVNDISLNQQMLVSLAVSGCIALSILISRVLGCCLPFIAKAIKIDPAVTAGPFITTLLDCSSLLIYFGLAYGFVMPAFG